MNVKQDTEIVILAQNILAWWEDAQYWESPSGSNYFGQDPLFIKKAKIIRPEYKEYYKGRI